ncbi:MAG: 3'-5' exoribonuclease [Bacteroidaceae bacterium]|nr:3'-5' exoribonuclease [Bacteroidaceae bacterium]
MDFVAIDFETANEHPGSICSVGMALVRQNRVTDTFYSLVRPEPEYYSYFCTRVHGLTLQDTLLADGFSAVWPRAEAFIGGLPLVAHNARFDRNCLRAALAEHDMPSDRYVFMDTLQASRRCFGKQLPNHRLDTVACACGFSLDRHHHALHDALAAAHIAIRLQAYLCPMP